MNNRKSVLFLCESIMQFNFFFRMKSAFEKIGYNCVFITPNYATYKDGNKILKNLILMTRHSFICNSDNSLNSLEFQGGELSEKKCRILYESAMFWYEQLLKRYSIELILGSQGIRVPEIAIYDFATLHNIKVLFYEWANIPGKLFWDIQGSNARSYLYNNIEILDKYEASNEDYKAWRKTYLENNKKRHVVKQKVNIKKFNLRYGLYSRFGCFYTGLKIREFNILKKMKSFILSRTFKVSYDQYDINKNRYYFFPMQVASDSQIILNSNINVFDGLLYSINEAKRNGTDLVVKLHPAEKDIFVLKKIFQYQNKYGFKIINDNTFEVIANAKKVITINSTIALEAMIIGVSVEILGKSYYSKFNENRLKNYILSFLVNMDFFSDVPFCVEEIEKLICFKE